MWDYVGLRIFLTKYVRIFGILFWVCVFFFFIVIFVYAGRCKIIIWDTRDKQQWTSLLIYNRSSCFLPRLLFIFFSLIHPLAHPLSFSLLFSCFSFLFKKFTSINLSYTIAMVAVQENSAFKQQYSKRKN